jgi:hypothetical protein
LIIALMAMGLLATLGAALMLVTSSESLIAGNFRSAVEGLHAADAGLERALADLSAVNDWNRLLDGSARSAFTDGPPHGVRGLADGSLLDLGRVLNSANCDSTTTQSTPECAASDLTAITAERPWGPNNPVWQLYAYGPLSTLLPAGTVESDFYVVVMVADDPSETDDDPAHDGAGGNPGAGLLSLRAEAFGPRRAYRAVEATVARRTVDRTVQDAPGESTPEAVEARPNPGRAELRILSWREVR